MIAQVDPHLLQFALKTGFIFDCKLGNFYAPKATSESWNEKFYVFLTRKGCFFLLEKSAMILVGTKKNNGSVSNLFKSLCILSACEIHVQLERAEKGHFGLINEQV